MTVKTYSPMTRTLVDSCLDIFFYIYNFKFDKSNNNNNEDTNLNNLFWTDAIVKIIIVFFNCIYNEFLVLYCFGMEKIHILKLLKETN